MAMKALLIALVAVSATSFSPQELTFSVSCEGLENRNVLKDGLKPSELSTFTVSANQKAVAVERLNVILARGEQPVLRETVTGNNFNIPAFHSSAKPGDRIVIEVVKISGSTEALNDQNKILQIPLI